MVSHTFQDQACIYFNNLPEHIRNCTDLKQSSKDTFSYLFYQVYNVDIVILCTGTYKKLY